jgi:hypothetical protein
MMLFPLLALVAFGAWRWWENQTPGIVTNERKAIYHFAMREERDPQKIAYWADWFAKEGLTDWATHLRNRIQVPQVHGEGRTLRQKLVRKALSSDNAAGIHGLACEFECQGYGATAEILRGYADGLQWAATIPECPLNSDLYDMGLNPPAFNGEADGPPPPVFTYDPEGNDIRLSPQSTADYQCKNPLVIEHVHGYARQAVAETNAPCVVFGHDNDVLYELKPVRV